MAFDKERNRRTLHRAVAIKISQAYSTVSMEAALVLAERSPWDLQAKERAMHYLEGGLARIAARTNTLRKWQKL